MKIVKKEMIHWMDEKASSEYYIPSILLMEHAGEALCQAFMKCYDPTNKVCIVCGPGNNGGDGLVLARLLHQHHYQVCIYTPVAIEKMSQDEAINACIIQALKLPYYQELDQFHEALKNSDVIVDALFGVGLARDIKGSYAEIIESINHSQKKIISIDIPSGIDGTTGKIKNVAIQAHHTFTLAAYKEGLFLNDARNHCGEIQLLDIQIPPELNQRCEGALVLDEEVIVRQLPKRKPYSHKGSYGKALMIGGSMNMHGALTLAAKACLTSGIGTLTLFVPDCITTILAQKLEECMLLSAPSKEGFFSDESIPLLKQIVASYDFIIIGNGMGRTQACLKLMEIVLESEKPCIIDGDGIYLTAQCEMKPNKSFLITPHVKEMSYLCHCDMKSMMDHPFDQIKAYMNTYPNGTIVYKDAFTLIQDHQRSYFYYLPNTALAKGGSGDVLCGIIAGMYGQCKSFVQAANCGVYIHSMCAKETKEIDGEDASQANDLIIHIGKVLKKLRNS